MSFSGASCRVYLQCCLNCLEAFNKTSHNYIQLHAMMGWVWLNHDLFVQNISPTLSVKFVWSLSQAQYGSTESTDPSIDPFDGSLVSTHSCPNLEQLQHFFTALLYSFKSFRLVGVTTSHVPSAGAPFKVERAMFQPTRISCKSSLEAAGTPMTQWHATVYDLLIFRHVFTKPRERQECGIMWMHKLKHWARLEHLEPNSNIKITP